MSGHTNCPTHSLCLSLRGHLNSQELSDLTIHVPASNGRQEVKVFFAHKAFLACRTNWFSLNRFRENEAHILQINEYDSNTVWFLLQYCYIGMYYPEGNWDLNIREPYQREDHNMIHIRVYKVALDMDIPPLRRIAAEKFYAFLRGPTFSLNDFSSVVKHVYHCTQVKPNAALRQVVIRFATEKLQILYQYENFQQLLREMGEFSSQILLCKLNTIPEPDSGDVEMMDDILVDDANAVNADTVRHAGSAEVPTNATSGTTPGTTNDPINTGSVGTATVVPSASGTSTPPSVTSEASTVSTWTTFSEPSTGQANATSAQPSQGNTTDPAMEKQL